ncbi:hypothetical protein [Methylobacterium organophilum]|uniref:Uncharacterized protein n=1 Tax=Methylobacterium organophilum TaxID=410 RepID=A0ABQ4T511_METOR|nr:hypothetical protein [Methylobacterium organophilum]GJE26746.1 hypothetical protein LKMONMHP_1597 [Methylobacterium organophilum]
MALDVDGYAVLQAMGAAPEAFPDIQAEVPRLARTLVVKQLKVRSLKVAGLRLIRDVVGMENFALIADGMSDAEVKSLVTRLDPHHPSLREATPTWFRRRLTALAAGDAPIRKGETPPAKPAPEPQAERALASRPFAATWDGKDHDAPAEKKSEKKGKKDKKKG